MQQNPQVAIVFDDIASVNPWKVRGIEIRGTVELLSTGGEKIGTGFGPEIFRLTPNESLVGDWTLRLTIRPMPAR